MSAMSSFMLAGNIWINATLAFIYLKLAFISALGEATLDCSKTKNRFLKRSNLSSNIQTI
jgi:hypothetical protein